MITVSVTSDSSVPELRVAERTISDLIKLAIGKDMEKPTLSEIAEHFKVPLASEVQKSINEAVEDLYVNGTSTLEPRGIFNAAELQEAEQLGKPVCSTVDASQSTTAPVDIQDNTSLPAPTSVFGQPVQTTANVANPVAPPTDNLVLDADGLPWDERIHSSSKEPVKDGTWRKRRGVSDELVKQVEAELRQPELVRKALANVQEVVATRLHDQLMTATATEFATIASFPETEPVTVLPEGSVTYHPEAPYVNVNVPLPPPTTDMTFTELLDAVTKAMVAGQLSQQAINGALALVGLTALPHLLGNPQLIPSFRTALGGVV